MKSYPILLFFMVLSLAVVVASLNARISKLEQGKEDDEKANRSITSKVSQEH